MRFSCRKAVGSFWEILDDGKVVWHVPLEKQAQLVVRMSEHNKMLVKKVFHIFEDMSITRDPDGRNTAFSLCGQHEECSGSGKHNMVDSIVDSNCELCCQKASKKMAKEESERALDFGRHQRFSCRLH